MSEKTLRELLVNGEKSIITSEESEAELHRRQEIAVHGLLKNNAILSSLSKYVKIRRIKWETFDPINRSNESDFLHGAFLTIVADECAPILVFPNVLHSSWGDCESNQNVKFYLGVGGMSVTNSLEVALYEASRYGVIPEEFEKFLEIGRTKHDQQESDEQTIRENEQSERYRVKQDFINRSDFPEELSEELDFYYPGHFRLAIQANLRWKNHLTRFNAFYRGPETPWEIRDVHTIGWYPPYQPTLEMALAWIERQSL